MKLFNTKTRQLEDFKPNNPSEISIYTCGPTVYSAPHIGNFAAYIYWDLLIRTLKLNNYKVRRILNLTDVGHLSSDGDTGEDKLEKGARKEGKTVWEIADYYIDKFKADYKKLNLIEPEIWARATSYITESEKLVQKLIDNGFTYETTDGIYFDTSKYPEYADFAKLDLENLKAGARVNYSKEKKNPSDFAVWKFIQPNESHAMRWKFLGHDGYPGWHLECSTIIEKEFENLPIDIHTGGIDHIPVHHTNEIAQTFGATGKPLANYWLHCNFIKINGEKISKSLGNIITLNDLEDKGFSVFDYKLWLYQGSYHNERNFTWEDLKSAKNRRLKWLNSRLFNLQKPVSSTKSPDDFKEKLLESLNNDLNSAETFSYIDSIINELGEQEFELLDELFGLNLCEASLSLLPSKYSELISARETARKEKDFSVADKIRDELLSKKLTVLDTSDGPVIQLLS